MGKTISVHKDLLQAKEGLLIEKKRMQSPRNEINYWMILKARQNCFQKIYIDRKFKTSKQHVSYDDTSIWYKQRWTLWRV